MSYSTEQIVGWNILPEEIKAIKLQQLVDLSRTFDRWISEIVISEYERSHKWQTRKPAIYRVRKPQATFAWNDLNPSREDSNHIPLDWSIEETKPTEDEDSLDWGNAADDNSGASNDWAQPELQSFEDSAWNRDIGW